MPQGPVRNAHRPITIYVDEPTTFWDYGNYVVKALTVLGLDVVRTSKKQESNINMTDAAVPVTGKFGWGTEMRRVLKLVQPQARLNVVVLLAQNNDQVVDKFKDYQPSKEVAAQLHRLYAETKDTRPLLLEELEFDSTLGYLGTDASFTNAFSIFDLAKHIAMLWPNLVKDVARKNINKEAARIQLQWAELANEWKVKGL